MAEKTIEERAAEKSRAQLACDVAERLRDEALITAGSILTRIERKDLDLRWRDDGEMLLLALQLVEVAKAGTTANTPGWTPPKSSKR